jgi:hypothetical protein
MSNVGVHRWRCAFTGGVNAMLGVISSVPALDNATSFLLPGSYAVYSDTGTSYQGGIYVECPFEFESGDELTLTLDCTRGVLRYESSHMGIAPYEMSVPTAGAPQWWPHVVLGYTRDSVTFL